MPVRIGELLLKEKRITPDQLQQALNHQKTGGGKLGYNLVKMGFVKDEEITALLSKQYGVPSINLTQFEIDPAVIKLIPADTAQKYQIVPLSRAGATLRVVSGQLAGSLPDGCSAANTVVAYEPVWAIGTGLTPTAADVAEVHAAVRAALKQRFGSDGARMRILYGGSVKPANARELMSVANVDGALVGGASLKADDFLGIIAAYVR